ncbi:MAG: TIGR04282 family arsenosugar biosynthesis glycosyltransferase [Burkholderiaceae bacterium]
MANSDPMASTACLILFAREPELGRVKQRLAADIGPQAALAVYRRLLERSLRLSRSFVRHGYASSAGSGRTDCRLIVSSFEDGQGRLRQFCRRTNTAFRVQCGNDLGQRMHSAIDEAVRDAVGPVVLIGSDCPGLGMTDLRAAFDALQRVDVVISPTLDGGYGLIGVRNNHRELFREIPWGSDQVAALTRMRARCLGLQIHNLRDQADIDFVADWRAWCAQRQEKQLCEFQWDQSAC